MYPTNVIPSDHRFREDVFYLYLGDQEKSAEWKEKLEVKARRDRTMRAERSQK